MLIGDRALDRHHALQSRVLFLKNAELAQFGYAQIGELLLPRKG
jgi:hypothetical protein